MNVSMNADLSPGTGRLGFPRMKLLFGAVPFLVFAALLTAGIVQAAHGSPWLLVPAAASLALFAWLLTLHPTAAGRVYAAYGGVYVSVAIFWLWAVDGVRPSAWDWLGVLVCLSGMAIIMFAPRSA